MALIPTNRGETTYIRFSLLSARVFLAFQPTKNPRHYSILNKFSFPSTIGPFKRNSIVSAKIHRYRRKKKLSRYQALLFAGSTRAASYGLYVREYVWHVYKHPLTNRIRISSVRQKKTYLCDCPIWTGFG